ncbi:MAG: helix-turn-helix domain-containing protein [Armatimonadota bacterium]|jgi:predicted site-specific integrase-resolvase
MAPLITLEQARVELGISRTTLYHLIRTGELEVIHLRGCKRIAPEALAKLTGRKL